jgi:hypothetical protein
MQIYSKYSNHQVRGCRLIASEAARLLFLGQSNTQHTHHITHTHPHTHTPPHTQWQRLDQGTFDVYCLGMYSGNIVVFLRRLKYDRLPVANHHYHLRCRSPFPLARRGVRSAAKGIPPPAIALCDDLPCYKGGLETLRYESKLERDCDAP